ncbi:MAG: hypothetical protein R3Y61_06905 [Rikenellaceae bacterium]
MIKRKIKLGFLCISILLFLSGMISIWELNRLNSSTSQLLIASKGNIELSKRLLDAVQEQNTFLLLSITDSTNNNYTESIEATRKSFQITLGELGQAFVNSPSASKSLSNIKEAEAQYIALVNGTALEQRTTKWFVNLYGTKYSTLTVSIKDFMMNYENGLIDSAKTVEGDAVRASMIGVIALAAGLLLVVLFYFLLKGFFITPVLKIDHSLNRYVERGIPFSAQIQSKDEIQNLYENINIIISRSKQNRGV